MYGKVERFEINSLSDDKTKMTKVCYPHDAGCGYK